jgi:hypothetical protein
VLPLQRPFRSEQWWTQNGHRLIILGV